MYFCYFFENKTSKNNVSKDQYCFKINFSKKYYKNAKKKIFINVDKYCVIN